MVIEMFDEADETYGSIQSHVVKQKETTFCNCAYLTVRTSTHNIIRG